MFSYPLLFVDIVNAVIVKCNVITVVFFLFFSQIRQAELVNEWIVWIPLLFSLNGQLQFRTLAFDTMTVEKLNLVHDILGQRLAIPLFIKFSISFHNVGTHLFDLCNTATQANTKNVRGNMTWLFMTLVSLLLRRISWWGVSLSLSEWWWRYSDGHFTLCISWGGVWFSLSPPGSGGDTNGTVICHPTSLHHWRCSNGHSTLCISQGGVWCSLSPPGLGGDTNGTVIWHPTSLHRSQYVRFGGTTNGQCVTQQRVTSKIQVMLSVTV
jgi:hypothetical protein